MDLENTFQEVLITSSTSCSIYDANNGNEIASYKDDNIFSHKALSLIGNDYLIGAYPNKPILKVWTLSKQRKQEVGSFVVPGIVSTLTVSNCGNYCIAGIKEQIYVWEVSTGEVINILCRHYQAVTCLKFTDDDSCLFSGGKDGHVIVWLLAYVVDVSNQETVKPHFIWNKHSAEVTDIYCGSVSSRVATTSLDMTCKIYELDTGLLLTSICMDVPLMAVVMDLNEYFIFLADDRGYFYKINTYERLPREIHRADMNNKVAIKLHESKIISLSLTIDGRKIMTASEDRTCKFWDLESLACILNIRFDGPLTNAFLVLKPSGLSKEMKVPELCVRSFQKDIYSSRNMNKYIESATPCKELTLMHDGCPDKYYSYPLFCQSRTNMEEINAAACEENFKEAIHGESLSNVAMLNQQLYSVTIGHTLKMAFGNPPSPS